MKRYFSFVRGNETRSVFFIVFMFSFPCVVEIGYLPFSLELPHLSDTSSMWPHPVLPPDPAAFCFFSSPTVKGCFCCYVTGTFPTFINSSEPFRAVPLCRGRAEAGVAVGWGGLSAGECTYGQLCMQHGWVPTTYASYSTVMLSIIL